MKDYKTETKTVEQKRLVQTNCDFCEVEIKDYAYKALEKDLKHYYEFEGIGYGPDVDVTVRIEMRNSYPECGSSKTIEMDVCHKCFKEKIMSQAKRYDEVDNDW
jgi:hypothetical protein